MHVFHTEVLDRRTGELVRICDGEFVTLTELGQAFSLGPRQVRQVLKQIGWLEATRQGRGRYRLAPAATAAGYGKHIQKSRSGWPFDVVSPEGQKEFARLLPRALQEVEARESSKALAAREQLEAFKAGRLDKDRWNTRMEVQWIRSFRPDLTQEEIAAALNLSEQLVSYHLRRTGEKIVSSTHDRPTTERKL